MEDEVVASHAVGAFAIGLAEIVLALIVVICSFVLKSKVDISTSLTPYWAAFPYLVPGILGVLLMFKRNMCLMIGFLVCNIITFIVQGIGCIVIGIVVAIYATYADGNCTYGRNLSGESVCRCKDSSGHTWTFYTSKSNCDLVKDVSTLLYVLVTFLALASIVGLAGCILGCIATCCRDKFQQSRQPLTSNPPPYGAEK